MGTPKTSRFAAYAGWVQGSVYAGKRETLKTWVCRPCRVRWESFCGGVRVSCGVADGGRLGKEVA